MLALLKLCSMVTSDYYNVLVIRYDDDCVPHEQRFMVSVDSFSSWLKCADLKHSEVTIRDIETLSFQCPLIPSWFKYGD